MVTQDFRTRIESWLLGLTPLRILFFGSLPPIFLFLNLHMTSAFSLAIDNELALGRTNTRIHLLEGRWGLTVIESLFGSGVVPWVSYVIFAILFSLAFLILFFSVTNELDWRAIPAFAIAATLPTLWLLLIFRPLLIPGGLSYLFVSISLLLLTNSYVKARNRLTKLVVFFASILFLTFAISTYQAFLTVFLVGVCAVGLFGRFDGRGLLSFWFRSLLALAASLGLFQLVNVMIQTFLNYESGGYITSFWRADLLWEKPLDHLRNVFFFLTENIFTMSSALGRTAWLVPILVIAAWVIILKIKNQTPISLRVVSLFGFVTTPFTIAIFAAGPDNTPLRSLVALPFFFALLAYALLTARTLLFKALGSFLIFGIVLQFISITAEYSAVDQLRNEFDGQLASQIYSRLDSNCNIEGGGIRVAFVGERDFVSSLANARGSTYGASIFSWDSLSEYPWRVNELMRVRGYGNFNAVQLSTVDAKDAVISSMGVFPSDNSIVCHNGVNIVKLAQVSN